MTWCSYMPLYCFPETNKAFIIIIIIEFDLNWIELLSFSFFFWLFLIVHHCVCLISNVRAVLDSVLVVSAVSVALLFAWWTPIIWHSLKWRNIALQQTDSTLSHCLVASALMESPTKRMSLWVCVFCWIMGLIMGNKFYSDYQCLRSICGLDSSLQSTH